MAISYLSVPIESKVKPYSENVGLIAQVAAQKQNRYDNILSTIFQKQNQLLSLDTSQGSEEAEQRKDNLLKEADNQLNKMASSDLTIPDNISKVENIFSPIINDKDVMGAASITAFTKEQAAYFDEWKKDGKGLYDAKNEAYFLEQVQKNRKMTLQEVKEKGYKQPTSVEFVDIDKWYRDSVKELLPDVTSVIAPDGQGRIFYQNGKKLSENDILQMLPTNTKIIAQAEINAHYDYQNVDGNQLLGLQQQSLLREQSSIKAIADDSSKQLRYLNDQILSIQNNTTDGVKMVENSGLSKDQLIEELKSKVKNYSDTKSQYEKSYQDYTTKLNEFNSIYGFSNGTFNKQLSEDELKGLKTSTWLSNKKQQFAEAMAYEEKTVKVEYDQVQMEAIKHQYGLEDKYIDYVYDKALEEYKISIDPKTSKALTIDTDGDGIPDAGDESILNAFGTTTSDENQEVLKLEEGQEYKQLSTTLIKPYDDLQRTRLQTIKNLAYFDSKYENVDQGTAIKLFQEDEENVRKILKQFEDPTIKGTDKIPNSEQTYNDFLKDNKTKKLLEYISEKDRTLNVVRANNGMLASIQTEAKNKALSDVNINVNTTLRMLDDPFNSGHTGSQIIIPREFTEKLLMDNLTEKDYNAIAQLNAGMPSLNVPNSLKAVKRIIKDGKFVDSNFTKFKTSFNEYKNEFAKQYAQGYKLPGLYIRDPESAKSVGKVIDTDIRQYIKSDAVLSEKYGKKDIEVRKIYKDPNSPSGWSASFNAFGTTVVQGTTIRQEPKVDIVNLQPSLVERYKLNLVSDVTEVEKNLNQQLLGNKTKNPIFMYNYMGKSYKFVMDKDTKSTMLLEAVSPKEFKLKAEGNINNLIEAIQVETALKFNK